jgi:hypothetical protein
MKKRCVQKRVPKNMFAYQFIKKPVAFYCPHVQNFKLREKRINIFIFRQLKTKTIFGVYRNEQKRRQSPPPYTSAAGRPKLNPA